MFSQVDQLLGSMDPTFSLHSRMGRFFSAQYQTECSPSFTVIMNTTVTLQFGAIPFYVDVAANTYCICPKDLRKKLKTKLKQFKLLVCMDNRQNMMK